MSMLARENKGAAAGKSDKTALAEVHDVLKRNYQVGPRGRTDTDDGEHMHGHVNAQAAHMLATVSAGVGCGRPKSLACGRHDLPTSLCCAPSRPPPPLQTLLAAFTFYAAAAGGGDPYHMSLNAFTSFLDDAGIPDAESASIKRSDCDTIFIVANYVADKKRWAGARGLTGGRAGAVRGGGGHARRGPAGSGAGAALHVWWGGGGRAWERNGCGPLQGLPVVTSAGLGSRLPGASA